MCADASIACFDIPYDTIFGLQEANGLASVYITEQGGWHALSNREQVAQYLMGRYINNQPFILYIRPNTFVINPYWKKITGSKKVEEKA